MKDSGKFILWLLVINLLFAAAGYILITAGAIDFPLSDILVLLAGFSVIGIITLLIFLKGRPKEPKEQTFYTLTAMGVKLLLDLVLALVWFALLKKNSSSSVIIYFVLYLAITLLSTFYFLKILRNKPL